MHVIILAFPSLIASLRHFCSPPHSRLLPANEHKLIWRATDVTVAIALASAFAAIETSIETPAEDAAATVPTPQVTAASARAAHEIADTGASATAPARLRAETTEMEEAEEAETQIDTTVATNATCVATSANSPGARGAHLPALAEMSTGLWNLVQWSDMKTTPTPRWKA